jgi:predicted small secreted protein
MKSESIGVVAGISSKGLLGPCFFLSTVTGESFLKLMKEEFVPAMQISQSWLMLDGARGHWAGNVRSRADEQFPGKWIGRGGPISWLS